MSLAQLMQSMQQASQQPTMGERFFKGMREKEEQEARELQRQRLMQQMEHAEFAEGRAAAAEGRATDLHEEHMSPEFQMSRLDQALGKGAQGRAQAATAEPMAQAQLHQQEVAAAYAEPSARLNLKQQQAAINASNASAALSRVNAQRAQFAHQLETDPQNLELIQAERESRIEKYRLEADLHREQAEYFRSDMGATQRESARLADIEENLATVATVMEHKEAQKELTKGQAEQVWRALGEEGEPEDVERLSQTEIGRNMLAARALRVKLQNDPSDMDTARELADVMENVERIRTITGRTHEDSLALSEPRIDTLLGVRDELLTALQDATEMRDAVVAEPTRAGAVGTFRRFGQTAVGIGTDLVGVLGPKAAEKARPMMNLADKMAKADLAAGNITSEDYHAFFDPTIAEIPAYENRMAYLLSKSRRGGSGRLTAEELNRTRQEISITGAKSSQDVVYRTNRLIREFEQSLSNIDARINRQKGEGIRPQATIGPEQTEKYRSILDQLEAANPGTDRKTLLEFARSKQYVPKEYDE